MKAHNISASLKGLILSSSIAITAISIPFQSHAATIVRSRTPNLSVRLIANNTPDLSKGNNNRKDIFSSTSDKIASATYQFEFQPNSNNNSNGRAVFEFKGSDEASASWDILVDFLGNNNNNNNRRLSLIVLEGKNKDLARFDPLRSSKGQKIRARNLPQELFTFTDKDNFFQVPDGKYRVETRLADNSRNKLKFQLKAEESIPEPFSTTAAVGLAIAGAAHTLKKKRTEDA